VAAGGVADWVIMYPVTATLSVALNALMLTDRLAAAVGMVNAVTAGVVVSGVEAVTAMFTVTGVPTAETLPASSLAQQ
jgi:NADH:ubiquinone oxidoreductase subunit E